MAIFGNTTNYTETIASLENRIDSGYFYLSERGIPTSITIYGRIAVAPSFRAKAAIYNSSKNLMVTSNEVNVGNTSYAPITFSITNTVELPTGYYYISAWAENISTAGATFYIGRSFSGGTGVFYQVVTYNGFPTTYSAFTLDADSILDIYCTYTPVNKSQHTIPIVVNSNDNTSISNTDEDISSSNNKRTVTSTTSRRNVTNKFSYT